MINIISFISVIGVSVGSMALIVVLSIFNGFEGLISSLFTAFDPDIKIMASEGKSFVPDSSLFTQVKEMEGVIHYAEVIEENALLRYEDQQYIATIKGVSSDYNKLTGIDSMIIEGEFLLRDQHDRRYAVIGVGIQYFLSIGLNFSSPLFIYVPKENVFNPLKAFNRKDIFPSGVFSVEKEIDSKYVIVPIDFARELLDYHAKVTAIEIKTAPGTDMKNVQEEIQELLGDEFQVKNRYQLKEFFYKVMRSEKWAIFFILTFILIIASFNIIGSLTMLIIDKKKDMFTLKSLGADISLIRKVFLIEGWLISLIGAVSGLFLGFIICWIQETFGIIKLYGANSFIINAYPVDMNFIDFISVFFTVLLIGFVAAWYPVRYITKKHLDEFNQ